MANHDPSQKLLILDLLETNFADIPYPEFAGLYDQSRPIQYPELIVTSNGRHHCVRIAAEEFRTERPFADYNLFHLEEAFGCFSAQALAYFLPKILHFLISEGDKEHSHNFEDHFWPLLQDQRSNKTARLFCDTTKLYSIKQRQTLGLTLLFLCFRNDADGDDYTSVWFYKETLKFLFDPEAD